MSVITLSQVFKIKYNAITCISILSNRFGWCLLTITKAYCKVQLLSILFGCIRLFRLQFKIKGFGFRFIKTKTGVYTKLDNTHRIIVKLVAGQKLFFINKYRFTVNSRNLFLLKRQYQPFIFHLQYRSFKKLGIFLKGLHYLAKLSKKKTKY